ncbi:MAG: T9SS type A sorting domain-containing protein [Duncaniella sp.]|nr:T9SS type A sorting domain-containing protein [Duncaniella sp.]
MKLKFLSVALLMLVSGATTALADVILTVNGQKVEKSVTRLTFDGDNVKVAYGDNSTSHHDMAEVAFSFSSSSGISAVSSFGAIAVSVGNQLEVAGVAPGCTLQVFDVRGRLVAQETAVADECTVDISHLEGGVYILKAGKEIVKFVKR